MVKYAVSKKELALGVMIGFLMFFAMSHCSITQCLTGYCDDVTLYWGGLPRNTPYNIVFLKLNGQSSNGRRV